MLDLVLTANSPGEVAGWVKPVAPALKEALPGARVTVFVPPCTFASGCELEVVAGLPGVDAAFGAGDFLRYALLGIVPAGFHPGRHGAVLFLGGDLYNAVLLRKRLGYPALAYTEGFVNWTDAFARFAVPYTATRERILAKGVPEAKAVVVGNLMLDAVRPGREASEVRQSLDAGAAELVLLLPGSRPAEVALATPLLVRAAELLHAARPQTRFVLSLSPFARPAQLAEALAGSYAAEWGARGTVLPDGTLLAGDCRIPVRQGDQYDLMAAADLALTIPGTNTAELAFLGVPMVVALPLNHPELIPVEGLAGLIGNLPQVGKALKRRIIPRLAQRIPHAAWPNRLAGTYLVPELRGQVSAAGLADESASLLGDPARRAAMARDLRQVMGEPGAAGRLAELVATVIAATRAGGKA